MFFFTESAPRPIQSLSRDVRNCLRMLSGPSAAFLALKGFNMNAVLTNIA